MSRFLSTVAARQQGEFSALQYRRSSERRRGGWGCIYDVNIISSCDRPSFRLTGAGALFDLHSPVSAALSRGGERLGAVPKDALPEREGKSRGGPRERRSCCSDGGKGPRRSHLSVPLSVEVRFISRRSGRPSSPEKFRPIRGSLSLSLPNPPVLLRDSMGGRTLPLRHSP
jgi:hypothetical protein